MKHVTYDLGLTVLWILLTLDQINDPNVSESWIVFDVIMTALTACLALHSYWKTKKELNYGE